MKIYTYIVLLILTSITSTHILQAQPPTPAPKQAGSILIKNARIHIGNGESIDNGVLAFDDGKIILVADATTARVDESKYDEVVSAEGKDIYPGFIAMNTRLGLVEIDAVRATNDYREVGSFTPSVRSLIAYNTDSDITPTIRSNGILLAQIAPFGGVITGTSSVVQLDAWNWEDAAYNIDEGVHLNWPSEFRRGGWWAQPGGISKNNAYEKSIAAIRAYFQEAKAYLIQENPNPQNLNFEALRGVFKGNQTLYVHENMAKSMMSIVEFFKEFDIKPTLVGGSQSYLIADYLAKEKIPVVLTNVQSLPANEDADIDQPYKCPKILAEAGVLFTLSMGGAWEQRNLPFQAGQAISYGLPYEEAVQSLTLNAAKILGIDKNAGSIEVGKDANFFISKGDIFDMRTSQVEQAYIQGRAIDLDNKQKALTRKFQEKYKREE